MVVHGGEQQEISHHVHKNAIESGGVGPRGETFFFIRFLNLINK